MKMSMYIIGSVEAVLGVLVLCLTSILQELMPVIGYVAFQNTMTGGYSPNNYALSFGFARTLAVILIVAGVLQLLLAFFKKENP